MERRRRKSTSTDELGLVKAAAWAWYQHGSGNEGKHRNEFGAARPPMEPRPTRYKLEAIGADGHHKETTPDHDTEMSLLDRYEIERITMHLNRLVLSNSGESRRRKEELSSQGSVNGGRGGLNGKKAVTRMNGFWIRQAIGICSSRAEAVVPVEGKVLVRRGGGGGGSGHGVAAASTLLRRR